jgi:myo-inositol-1(or 4)-monophosphatase
VDDLELAIACARAGAAVVSKHFGARHEIALKSANNPVTAVDRESEAAIVQIIRAHRPRDTIIAEEGSGLSGGARRWLVDPLDGTVNFVHGIPHIAVSVALYEGNEPLVGVIADPLRDELYTAAKGDGAQCNGQAISAAGAAELASSVIATGFAYDHDAHAAEYTRPLTAVLARVNGVRRFGSAALDLAWTASGRFDGYWELGVAPWDIAAGMLLVREASGVVTDPFGRWAHPETSLVVAAGPEIHEPLRRLVEANLPQRLR